GHSLGDLSVWPHHKQVEISLALAPRQGDMEQPLTYVAPLINETVVIVIRSVEANLCAGEQVKWPFAEFHLWQFCDGLKARAAPRTSGRTRKAERQGSQAAGPAQNGAPDLMP